MSPSIDLAAEAGRPPFREVEMPPRFILDRLASDRSWIDCGLFEAESWIREPDGAYCYLGYDGSRLLIRCVRQDGLVVDALDEDGASLTYRFFAVPTCDHCEGPESSTATDGESEGSRRPRAPGSTKPVRSYRTVEMPNRFILECLTPTGDWIDWGLFDADEFERQEDGAYLNAAGGSPLWLRCMRQDGAVLYGVDGAGDPYTYRMVAFPGGGYTAS